LHRTTQNVHASRDQPTQEYSAFEQSFDFFNAALFEGRLPPCLITLQRRTGSNGYYSSQRFETRDADARTDEVALNPATFKGRSVKEILSTLVHEMCHHWQFRFGRPSRGRYHNREWADKMEALGLIPSDTGLPGGARTGQAMTHYVLDDGPFSRACGRLLADGFVLTWQDPGALRAARAKNQIKYTCPECGQNAWAKPDAQLVCAPCCWHMGASGVDAPPYREAQPAPAPPEPEAEFPVGWEKVLKTVRAKMAKKYHPDAGGSDVQMAVVNNVFDCLADILQHTKQQA
jgi:predicted SprT family Zn-dependent metalloprotease